jgi:hypothetical protein
MSKPLPTQVTFATVSPPWSLSSLDANFTNVFAALNDYGTYNLVLADTGVANALVVTPAAGLTLTLATGLTLVVVPAFATTSSAPTLNANGTGAKTITDNVGNPLPVGAMNTGGRYIVSYDGTNWRLLNPTFFQPQVAFKASNTARSNTTTNVNDPELVLALPTAGTYDIEVVGWFAGTAGGIGLNFNVNYSGTVGSQSVLALGFSYGGTTFGSGTTAGQIPSTQGGALFSTSTNSSNQAVPSTLYARGSLITTTAGTLGFAWSQTISSGNSMSMLAGSFMKATVL